MDSAGNAAIKMVSSMATRQLLERLVHAYGGANPPIALESAGGVNVVKRVEAGEAVDWIVLGSDAIARLAEAGLVNPSTRVDLFASFIAVAVRDNSDTDAQQSALPLDISSEQSLKAAVRSADSIGYSTGPSGLHLLRVFAEWGIADEIASKLVQAPAGVPVGAMLQQGHVTLGFQQLSELQDIEGIRIVGLLPPAVQLVTVFSMAMHVRSDKVEAYPKWVDFLTSPSQYEAIRASGMTPFQAST